eukprot:GHVP01053780.1.p1 GENE.GHVP01053780.1~~GHVP01053780.1.p1  ORF type:complete len:639 (+),score=97.99 GHVP01053780.1:611-2527(+)
MALHYSTGTAYELKTSGDWEEQKAGSFSYQTQDEISSLHIAFFNIDEPEKVDYNFDVPYDSRYKIGEHSDVLWNRQDGTGVGINFLQNEDFHVFCNIIEKVFHNREEDLDGDDMYFPKRTSFNSLPELNRKIESSLKSILHKDMMTNELTIEYCFKLVDLLKTVREDNIDGLPLIRKTLRLILSISTRTIIDEFFKEKNIYDLIDILSDQENIDGIKEDFTKKTRITLPELKSHGRLPIYMEDVFKYRYIKENFKELGGSTSTGNIIRNSIRVRTVNLIKEFEMDIKFLVELVDSVLEESSPLSVSLLGFLREAVFLARSPFPFQGRTGFSTKIPETAIKLIKGVLERFPEQEELCIDLFHTLTVNDVNCLRDYIPEEESLPTNKKILAIIIKTASSSKSIFTRNYALKAIRCLFDESFDKKIKDKFLNILYPQYVVPLFEEFEKISETSILDYEGYMITTDEQEDTYTCLCDILGCMIIRHRVQSKSFLNMGNIFNSILTLLSAKKNILKINSVRVIKHLIETKDESYYKKLCDIDAFGCLIRCVIKDGIKNSMLTSSFLDIFVLINKNKSSTTLQKFIKANHRDILTEWFFSYSPIEQLFSESIPQTHIEYICDMDGHWAHSDSEVEITSDDSMSP